MYNYLSNILHALQALHKHVDHCLLQPIVDRTCQVDYKHTGSKPTIRWTEFNKKLSKEVPEMTQKMISLEIDKNLKVRLAQSSTDKRDKARIASLGLQHAGDWLNVIPSPVLGLHVRPQEFRYSVLYRLGAPIYPSAGPCPACKRDSDRYGDHAIVCGSHGERIARHNQLRDAIYQVAASANLAPRKEENALLPGTNARPADVFIPNWTGGRDTALDVTVVSPLLTDRVDNSITTPGHTLEVAFNEKCRDYMEACEREGIIFITVRPSPPPCVLHKPVIHQPGHVLLHPPDYLQLLGYLLHAPAW